MGIVVLWEHDGLIIHLYQLLLKSIGIFSIINFDIFVLSLAWMILFGPPVPKSFALQSFVNKWSPEGFNDKSVSCIPKYWWNTKIIEKKSY